MPKFRVIGTDDEDCIDDQTPADAYDSEMAAEEYMEENHGDNENCEQMELSVKSEDGTVERFTVVASLTYTFSARKLDAED